MSDMAKSKNDKLDGDIIEYLMVADNVQTAKSIAKAIGLKKAKDVNNRLASLHTKNILSKIKLCNQVFWSIEQTHSETENSLMFTEAPAKEADTASSEPNENITTNTNQVQTTGGHHDLSTLHMLVSQLRDEVCLLRRKIECIDIQENMLDQSIPFTTQSLAKPPSNVQVSPSAVRRQLQKDQNSWSPNSPNKSSAIQNPLRPHETRPVSPHLSDFGILNPMWCSDNRFASLSFTNNCESKDSQGNYQLDKNAQQQTDSKYDDHLSSGKPKRTRRPPVCTSEQHLRKYTPPSRGSTPIVPGIQTYSKAHENTISIVTDSMTNRIRARDFNEDLPDGARAIFKKFPGAVASEIREYAAVTINRDTPRGLIAVAVTNDVGYLSRGKRQPDVFQIAQDILDIGVSAKSKGVKNIFISSIITRKGFKHEIIRREVNKILYNMCICHDFYYIDNDNISVEHLWEDGLHLNDSGVAIFQSNLKRCFDESLYIY